MKKLSLYLLVGACGRCRRLQRPDRTECQPDESQRKHRPFAVGSDHPDVSLDGPSECGALLHLSRRMGQPLERLVGKCRIRRQGYSQQRLLRTPVAGPVLSRGCEEYRGARKYRRQRSRTGQLQRDRQSAACGDLPQTDRLLRRRSLFRRRAGLLPVDLLAQIRPAGGYLQRFLRASGRRPRAVRRFEIVAFDGLLFRGQTWRSGSVSAASLKLQRGDAPDQGEARCGSAEGPRGVRRG